MSTALNAADNHQIKVDYIEGARIAIVVADWNSKYTYALLDGAQSAFAEAGYSDGQPVSPGGPTATQTSTQKQN